MDEQNKGVYYIALRQTQDTIRTDSANWQPWVVFFLSSLASQVKRLAEKVDREKMLSQRLPKLSADLVALAKLAKDGHLVKHGVGRGTWYVASSH